MKLEWNLEKLFDSDDTFYTEMELLHDEWNKICFPVKYTAINLEEKLSKEASLLNRTNKVLVYGNLRYYQNVKSAITLKLKKEATDFESMMFVYKKMLEADYIFLGLDTIKQFIIENPNLEEYRFYLENLFRLGDYIPDSSISWKITSCEEGIQNNQILYDKMLSEITFDNKETKLTLADYLKYLTNDNRDIRKNTYFYFYNSFSINKKEFANILNKIFKNRNKIRMLEGYNSVLEKVLLKENLNNSMINNLISSVHNNLDILRRYLKLKTDYFGIKEPHLYDLGISLGNTFEKKYTLEEAIKIIHKALSPLGDKYINIVDELLSGGYIDASVNDKKHPTILFSWRTYSFLNFKGTYFDLKNLIHEIGHIVNYRLSEENVCYLYEDSSPFISEISSIVNEILLNRYLYEKAKTLEEKIFFLSKGCENYFTSVFKQTMYTEFENALYERISFDKNLTSTFLNNTYFDLVKNYYGDDIIYDKEGAYEWIRLGHLYRHSYYPYQYATGLLLASLVVHNLIDEKSLSIDNYIKFLSSGSSNFSSELLKILNININDKAVFDNGFNLLKDYINKLEEIIYK